MGNFRFIRRKRNHFVSLMTSSPWIALIFTAFSLFMIVVVYNDGDDARDEVTVIQNRQILEEKQQGLRSREEELLEMAAKLEMELLQHQERIKVRLETLNARKKGVDGGRELDSPHHHHHQHQPFVDGGVEGTDHRLKRRLMDARTSHGLGRHPRTLVSKSDSSSAITRDDQTILGVKASKSNKTSVILRHAPKSRSLKRVWVADAKALLRTSHNENKTNSFDDDNKEINNNQSTSTLSMGRHLAPEGHHESQKLNNQTKGGPGKQFDQSSNFKNVLNNHHFTNGLPKANVISTSPAAATTILDRPSIEAEAHPDNAALIFDEPYLGCEDLAHVNSRELVGSGYTKRVERVELRDGRWVAVKSVWMEGNDVTACLDRGMTKRDCIQLANYKLMKETALLQQLRHPNIIKLLGFCVKDEDPFKGSGSRTPSSLTIVERGTPLTFINLLQMTWEDRLRVCLGISRLMVYLSESPLGSLAIHDFKLSQFVIVDGEIKLADLDDVDNNPSPCSASSECGVDMGTNITVYTSCSNGVCSNFSQKSNMAHSYLKFFVFLQLEQPRGMRELTEQLINNTKKVLWSPRRCWQHMQTILDYYQQGKYIDQIYTSNIKDSLFQVYHDHTADQGEDYWCSGTRQLAATCVLSVHNENEAIKMCLRDRQCAAFILTSERTWTGRYIAHFKKTISKSIQPSKGNTLFVFPTL